MLLFYTYFITADPIGLTLGTYYLSKRLADQKSTFYLENGDSIAAQPMYALNLYGCVETEHAHTKFANLYTQPPGALHVRPPQLFRDD